MATDEGTPLLPPPSSNMKHAPKKSNKIKLIIALSLFTTICLLMSALFVTQRDDSKQLSVETTADAPVYSEAAASITFGDLGNTWHDLTKEAKQAAATLKTELGKIDFKDIEGQLFEVPLSIKHALNATDVADFEQWLRHASEEGLKDALERLQAVDFKDLPNEALQYVEEHPGEVALYVVETVVFFVPGGVVWGPLLRSLGFAARGVKAGRIAALIQSRLFGGLVPKRGWFATLVSAAMGGHGRAKLDALTRFTVKIGSWLGWFGGHH